MTGDALRLQECAGGSIPIPYPLPSLPFWSSFAAGAFTRNCQGAASSYLLKISKFKKVPLASSYSRTIWPLGGVALSRSELPNAGWGCVMLVGSTLCMSKGDTLCWSEVPYVGRAELPYAGQGDTLCWSEVPYRSRS